MSSNAPIRRALLSVSDKNGVLELAQGLAAHNVELLSTGGTAKMLREAGLEVKEVSEHTGFPEMMDGRVKTLHPKIHGGLLGRRDLDSHQAAMAEHDIPPIDLVCVNLYPFAEVTARGCTLEEAIENIDIGGPSMLRSAAKNHEAVTVLVDPADYAVVLDEMKASGGATTHETRATLARKVYAATAAYDGMIADYLGNLQTSADEPFGETLHLPLTREANLRYGENPAQKAALYGNLSVQQEERAVVAILKHNTPCGVGAGANPREAYEKAFATDPESPFGGILICNQTWDLQLAETVDEIFTEVLIAPDFTEEALSLLQKKKNRRLMRWNVAATPTDEADIRRVFGGWLVQERDQSVEDVHTSNVATSKAPSATELQAMDFGWRVVKHIKSNAIVFCTADRTLGVGGGQTSRVDAVRIAIESAQRQGLSLAGSTIASDAFFPFPDGVALALDAGATSVVQPGGSVRDDAAIELADQRDVSMVLTGARHFRH